VGNDKPFRPLLIEREGREDIAKNFKENNPKLDFAGILCPSLSSCASRLIKEGDERLHIKR